MKYITVKLTEEQAYQAIHSLENDMVDHWSNQTVAMLKRIVTKLHKALALSQD